MRNRNNGYLLIEAMVAISLLLIGFFGFLSLLSNAISLNRVVSDQFTANYLAMEGIEIVKNLIDANYLQGSAWNAGFDQDKCYEVDYQTFNIGLAVEVGCPDASVNFLKFDDPQAGGSGRYSYDIGNNSPFKRTIHITPFSGGNEIKANSIVKWENRSGGFEINLEDHFFNWRP